MSNEKPKCGYELCDGPHKYMTTPPGRFTQYADCPGPVIATEPETPAPEVTCKCATADCSHYGGIDCEACGCKTPASDPTPELRETIGWALAQWIAEVTISDDSDRFDANRGVELVLSALKGEPK